MATSRSGRLTVDQLLQYNEQGYVKNLVALTETEVIALQKMFEELAARLPKDLDINQVNMWHKCSPWLYRLCRHPMILGYVEAVLGANFYQWGGQFFVKYPGDGSQVPWHQDAQYMQEYEPVKDRAVTAWIPLVPVEEHSGCLQVIPGSQTKGLRPEIRIERNNLLGLADDELAGMEPVSCIMDPGDVLLFSELIYHRSLENVSDYSRWSLDVRYFNAANQPLSAKETDRYRGDGYYCFSKEDPGRVMPYETWAASYDYDGEF